MMYAQYTYPSQMPMTNNNFAAIDLVELTFFSFFSDANNSINKRTNRIHRFTSLIINTFSKHSPLHLLGLTAGEHRIGGRGHSKSMIQNTSKIKQTFELCSQRLPAIERSCELHNKIAISFFHTSIRFPLKCFEYERARGRTNICDVWHFAVVFHRHFHSEQWNVKRNKNYDSSKCRKLYVLCKLQNEWNSHQTATIWIIW